MLCCWVAGSRPSGIPSKRLSIQASRIDPPLAKCGRELLDMLQNPIAHLGDQSKRAKQHHQEQRNPFDT